MLFENLIIAELMKSRLNSGCRPDFYFWRDNTGNEVDLIIDEGTRKMAIEIKSSRIINSDFYTGLDYWNKLSGYPADDLFLVYGGNQNQKRAKGTVVSWESVSEVIFK
jgi:uncharacterized protein